MEVELDFSKSVDENASLYFEKSKEARKKIIGLATYLDILKERQKKEESSPEKIDAVDSKKEKVSKKWFESFRWFFSSDNFLVVGGKDAKGNEELVKKRMRKNDVYFHAEVFGAPHCIIIAPEELKGKDFFPPELTMKEASEFAVTFSKAWEEVRPQADAYSVKPEQVSKSAKSGESMGTGAFMIYGERNWFKKTPLSCAIGYFPREKKLMCGPLSAVKKHCRIFLELKQGAKTKELIAKDLKGWFEKKGLFFSIDEFVSLLPSGGFEF